jgi:hypothetical protein
LRPDRDFLSAEIQDQIPLCGLVLGNQNPVQGLQGGLHLADMGPVIGIQQLPNGALGQTEALGECNVAHSLRPHRPVKGKLCGDNRRHSDNPLIFASR